VIGDLSLLVGFNVKDGDFWATSNQEAFAESADELLRVFAGGTRETIDSEVQSSEVAYFRLIRENTDVGSGSQAGKTVNEANIVGLNEDEVSSDFKGEGNSAQCFLIASDSFLFVFKDTLVGSGHFDFLSNLNY
jgi:hypothetical protein